MSGVLCPTCGDVGRVLETRRELDLIRRTRYCDACEKRWTTVECDGAAWMRMRNELAVLRETLRRISAQAAGAVSELPHVGEGRTMPERLGGKPGA